MYLITNSSKIELQFIVFGYQNRAQTLQFYMRSSKIVSQHFVYDNKFKVWLENTKISSRLFVRFTTGWKFSLGKLCFYLSSVCSKVLSYTQGLSTAGRSLFCALWLAPHHVHVNKWKRSCVPTNGFPYPTVQSYSFDRSLVKQIIPICVLFNRWVFGTERLKNRNGHSETEAP